MDPGHVKMTKTKGHLWQVLQVAVGKREALILSGYSAMLALRTFLSLVVADLDGRIVAALVARNPRRFIKGIVLWMLMALPASATNSILSYLHSHLSLALRRRLTHYLHSLYLSTDLSFYSLSALDDRITSPDHSIVSDTAAFAESFVSVYSNLAKPILDLVVYNYQLSKSVGMRGVLGMIAFVYASAAALQKMTPKFGKLTAHSQKLEAEFRSTHYRLIENAEEVAFFSGHEKEKSLLNTKFEQLKAHMYSLFRTRIWHTMLEDFIIKYVWGATGIVFLSLPVFFKKYSSEKITLSADIEDRTQRFVSNKRLLLSSSDASGRIMYSYKDITELKGYTERVYELIQVLKDVNMKKYSKTLSSNADPQLLAQRGELIDSHIIEFDHVPIVSPNGDVLLKDLSFTVRPGMHLLIVGPNGSGKSSLFRILGGLWPIYGGKVLRPSYDNMFYIPQRPYFSHGTLRDQVIYPDSKQDMIEKGVTDQDLLNILEVVQLDALVDREGGWDAEKDWKDMLAGGDKQRIAMARLFYHRPRYAILDECTSSVSMDIERDMYTHAQELGISLMTVSHRTTLWQYHNWILQFDGQGGYVFSPLDPTKRLALQEEKNQIEQQLVMVPKLEKRLQELLNF